MRRAARMLGAWISTATSVAAGYIWAKHGFLWGLALQGGILVIALALWGALNFPWRETAKERP